MPKLFILMLLLVSGFTALSGSAFADGKRQYRYHTNYSNWDNSFYGTYHYSERTTYTSCGYYTCYYHESESWRSNDQVYVEETVVEGGRWDGYDKVVVYNDNGYGDPYCGYYVRNNQVIYREYYSRHVYIYQPYTVADGVADIVKNFDTDLQTMAVIGGVAIDIGLDVAAAGASSGNQDATDAGLAIAAAGVVSAISASIAQENRNEQRTALANAVASGEKSQKTQMLKLR